MGKFVQKVYISQRFCVVGEWIARFLFVFEQVSAHDRGRDDHTMEKLSNPNGECVRARVCLTKKCQSCAWCHSRLKQCVTKCVKPCGASPRHPQPAWRTVNQRWRKYVSDVGSVKLGCVLISDEGELEGGRRDFNHSCRFKDTYQSLLMRTENSTKRGSGEQPKGRCSSGFMGKLNMI